MLTGEIDGVFHVIASIFNNSGLEEIKENTFIRIQVFVDIFSVAW